MLWDHGALIPDRCLDGRALILGVYWGHRALMLVRCLSLRALILDRGLDLRADVEPKPTMIQLDTRCAVGCLPGAGRGQ